MAEIHLTGRAASPGLAIGPVTVLTAAVARRTSIGDPAQEAAALKAAKQSAPAKKSAPRKAGGGSGRGAKASGGRARRGGRNG